MVKALIDARQVDVKRLIDELTTILKCVSCLFLRGDVILIYTGCVTDTRTWRLLKQKAIVSVFSHRLSQSPMLPSCATANPPGIEIAWWRL